MPISNPRTKICQGYSKMLTPVVRDWLSRQNSGVVILWKSNAQKTPVVIFDQNRQLRPNTATVPSQHL